MDHDYTPTTGNIAAVTFLAAFTGLRRFVLFLGICGMIAGGVVYWTGLAPVEVNTRAECSREWWVTPSQNDPLGQTGPFVRSAQGQLYVHSADGTGYCLLKHEDGWQVIDGVYRQRWWEVPTKYADKVAPSLPKKNYNGVLALALGGLSLMVIVFLWLPATLLAMFSRRVLKNAQEVVNE